MPTLSKDRLEGTELSIHNNCDYKTG